MHQHVPGGEGESPTMACEQPTGSNEPEPAPHTCQLLGPPTHPSEIRAVSAPFP